MSSETFHGKHQKLPHNTVKAAQRFEENLIHTPRQGFEQKQPKQEIMGQSKDYSKSSNRPEQAQSNNIKRGYPLPAQPSHRQYKEIDSKKTQINARSISRQKGSVEVNHSQKYLDYNDQIRKAMTAKQQIDMESSLLSQSFVNSSIIVNKMINDEKEKIITRQKPLTERVALKENRLQLTQEELKMIHYQRMKQQLRQDKAYIPSG